MESNLQFPCADCGNSTDASHPFCARCGALSPALTSEGQAAVELLDVPSEIIRDEVTRLLQGWFPDVDRYEAARRLKAGPTILLQGIDEESAERIIQALKRHKAPGRIASAAPGLWRVGRLLNPGLAISAAGLVLALLVGGAISIPIFLAAVAAPFLWAWLKVAAERPLSSALHSEAISEKWRRIARDYSETMARLDPASRETLAALTTAAFDLQNRLRSDSLPAVAAGEDRGDLFERLEEAIRAATDLARRASMSEGQEKERLSGELSDLAAEVEKTRQWFMSVEHGPVSEAIMLAAELSDAAQGIERILGHVAPTTRRGGARQEEAKLR